jgi:aromatic ring-cleaving dioxygenase
VSGHLDYDAGAVPMLNRAGLSILLHPGTGDGYADHTDHAGWFGGMLPLRLDVLRKRRRR